MSLPVRALPVLQNWDCHSCGSCCRDYLVRVTDEERARIEAQGWDKDPEMQGVPLFEKFGSYWNRMDCLGKKKEDGSCVFLDAKGGCRIHARFGSAAKPLACRLYPFMLIPTGDHWKVGIRFACPTATQNLGRPLESHQAEVREYANILEKQEGVKGLVLPTPILQRGQSAPWSDLFHFVRTLRGIIGNPQQPLEWRLRKAIALAQLCREAKFDKVTGNKLVEFLELISDGIEDDVLRIPEDLTSPGWIGRILFRQTVALYIRKDLGPLQGTSKRGRLALVWAAWRFARGTGRVPRLHAWMPATTFEAAEVPTGPIPKVSEELLTRFFLVKLESMQFCGPTNFHRGFWDGFESLMFLYPAIMWLSRVFHDRSREDAISLSVQIIDDNFGFNPLLGGRRQTSSMRTIAKNGDLSRLIAWYSR